MLHHCSTVRRPYVDRIPRSIPSTYQGQALEICMVVAKGEHGAFIGLAVFGKRVIVGTLIYVFHV